jgi:hypothetical protein
MIDRMGQQLGGYRLGSLLGRGSLADVYLAEHIYWGTQAAIKIRRTRGWQEVILRTFLMQHAPSHG